jgi:hypothetical protein
MPEVLAPDLGSLTHAAPSWDCLEIWFVLPTRVEGPNAPGGSFPRPRWVSASEKIVAALYDSLGAYLPLDRHQRGFTGDRQRL